MANQHNFVSFDVVSVLIEILDKSKKESLSSRMYRVLQQRFLFQSVRHLGGGF